MCGRWSERREIPGRQRGVFTCNSLSIVGVIVRAAWSGRLVPERGSLMNRFLRGCLDKHAPACPDSIPGGNRPKTQRFLLFPPLSLIPRQ